MGPGWLKAYTTFKHNLLYLNWRLLDFLHFKGVYDPDWEIANEKKRDYLPAWLRAVLQQGRWNCSLNVRWTQGKPLLFFILSSMRLDGRSLTWSALAILLRATSWINSSCRITWTLQPDQMRGSAISGSIFQ